jgi:hypothetical protein
MDTRAVIAALRRAPAALGALLEDVGEEQARWRPAPDKWSLLELACHLLDEEREDFRLRIELLLRDPALEWPPIDPEGWVRDRRYSDRDLAATLADWRAERARSLAWLEGLEAPDWSRSRRHPAGFELSAGDLLAAWAAHDLLHLRQAARLHLLWLKERSMPWRLDYAGNLD